MDDQTMNAFQEQWGSDPDPQPTGFFQTLPEGHSFTDGDQPMINSFAERMKSRGLSDATIHEALSWYGSYAEQAQMDREDADLDAIEKAEDALRAEWRDGYDTKLDLIQDLADSAPPELLDARLPDGVPLFSSIPILRWLGAALAGELVADDPVSTTDSGMSRAEIERIMREDRTRYNKDVAMQERYRELLEREYPPEEWT